MAKQQGTLPTTWCIPGKQAKEVLGTESNHEGETELDVPPPIPVPHPVPVPYVPVLFDT